MPMGDELSGLIDPQRGGLAYFFERLQCIGSLIWQLINYQGCLSSHGKHNELQVREIQTF